MATTSPSMSKSYISHCCLLAFIQQGIPVHLDGFREKASDGCNICLAGDDKANT